MITDFRYNDIVLYCKGWYATPEGDTMLDDLGFLLSEIYGWTPKREDEIAHFMLIILDKVLELQDCKFREGYLKNFSSLHSEIVKYQRLYDCSVDMAVIRIVHGKLQSLSREEIRLNPPHYGKHEHFRMGMIGGKYPLSQTYTEMNRRAQKAFNKSYENETRRI